MGGKQVAGRPTGTRGLGTRDWGLGNFHPLATGAQRLVPAFPPYYLLPTAYCLLFAATSTKSGRGFLRDESNAKWGMNGYQRANTFVKSTKEFGGTVML